MAWDKIIDDYKTQRKDQNWQSIQEWRKGASNGQIEKITSEKRISRLKQSLKDELSTIKRTTFFHQLPRPLQFKLKKTDEYKQLTAEEKIKVLASTLKEANKVVSEHQNLISAKDSTGALVFGDVEMSEMASPQVSTPSIA